MTRLLVTGGAGFIGSHIVQAALTRGWSVRVLDSLRPDVHGSRPVLPDSIDLRVGEVADRRVLDALDEYSLETKRAITLPLLRELLQRND